MPFRFYKGQPTEYVMTYKNGRRTRAGAGLAFFYMPLNTHVVTVPTSSRDAGFVFNEITGNFQAVTIQGQFTYRIASPEVASALLNFAIDPRRGTYLSDDPDRLPQRITNIVQMETRGEVQQRTLEQAITQSDAIAQAVFERARSGAELATLGVELLSVYLVAVKPTPEVAKALEAEHRETLLRRADEAVYARRAAAVQEERKIKENELNSSIALEEQREKLVELSGANTLRESEYRGRAVAQEGDYSAQAVRMELDAYQGLDPRLVLALAMRKLGDNAAKVGNLTITSEMLASLLDGVPPRSRP